MASPAGVSSVDSNFTSSKTTIVCYTGTKNKIEQEATVSWTIEDMKDKMISFQPGEWIRTDTFTIKNTKWYFRLYPNGYKLDYRGFISVFLTSENDEKCMVKCEFNGGKSDQGWFRSKPLRQGGVKEFTKTGSYSGFPKFISHWQVLQYRNQMISRGRMGFEMKAKLVEGETSSKLNLMEETSELNRLQKLSDNFSNLLWDEGTSDFQIVCGDDKFPVHRIVLKARSSFFSGLFSNDYAETKTGHITIEDIDSSTVKILIEYIYTGKIRDLEAKASQLLKAANKYDFSLLRKSCEDELISTANVRNAVDLFVLAEDHNASDLRVAAKKIILENKADIVKQEGWEAKLGTLVLELFREL